MKLPRLRLPEIENEEHPLRARWTVQTRVLVISLLYIAGMVTFILWRGTDSRLYETAVEIFGGGAVMLIGQFTFGKAWDNRNFLAFASQRNNVQPDSEPAADPPPASVSTTTTTTTACPADADDGPPRN